MNGGLESAVNLGRRCIQDFYLPRYFILENVRNFVSPAADDDGGFPPSLRPITGGLEAVSSGVKFFNRTLR